MAFLTRLKTQKAIEKSGKNPRDLLFKAKQASHDVFLSHSTKDEKELPGVIAFLEEFGVNVYIDKQDYELPTETSPKTAAILQKRIQECNRLILLVSENSKDSRWIPWELGYADSSKGPKNMAILPLAEHEVEEKTTWPSQEYLGLYKRIVFRRWKDKPGTEWMVVDSNNRGEALSDWLN